MTSQKCLLWKRPISSPARFVPTKYKHKAHWRTHSYSLGHMNKYLTVNYGIGFLHCNSNFTRGRLNCIAFGAMFNVMWTFAVINILVNKVLRVPHPLGLHNIQQIQTVFKTLEMTKSFRNRIWIQTKQLTDSETNFPRNVGLVILCWLTMAIGW